MPQTTVAQRKARGRRVLDALNRGVRGVRALAEASGASSGSIVAADLRRLEEEGEVVLLDGPHGLEVYDGSEFCTAWDTAARLAGNPEA